MLDDTLQVRTIAFSGPRPIYKFATLRFDVDCTFASAGIPRSRRSLLHPTTPSPTGSLPTTFSPWARGISVRFNPPPSQVATVRQGRSEKLLNFTSDDEFKSSWCGRSWVCCDFFFCLPCEWELSLSIMLTGIRDISIESKASSFESEPLTLGDMLKTEYNGNINSGFQWMMMNIGGKMKNEK